MLYTFVLIYKPNNFGLPQISKILLDIYHKHNFVISIILKI